jgi:hypothetical protein
MKSHDYHTRGESVCVCWRRYEIIHEWHVEHLDSLDFFAFK